MRFAADSITPSRTCTLCKILPGRPRDFVPVTINFFNSALDIRSTGDGDALWETYLNLLSSRHRFPRDRIRKYQKGEIVVQWTRYPFPCPIAALPRDTYIVRLSRLFVFRGYIDIRHTPTNPLSSEDLFHVSKGDKGPGFRGRVGRTAFLLDGRRLFTRSLERIRGDPADLKARTFLRSTNNRIRRRIRSNVCYNFCKGISCFYGKLSCISLHRIQHEHTRARFLGCV